MELKVLPAALFICACLKPENEGYGTVDMRLFNEPQVWVEVHIKYPDAVYLSEIPAGWPAITSSQGNVVGDSDTRPFYTDVRFSGFYCQPFSSDTCFHGYFGNEYGATHDTLIESGIAGQYLKVTKLTEDAIGLDGIWRYRKITGKTLIDTLGGQWTVRYPKPGPTSGL